MTRAENWKLILRLCEQANDDVITSVRVALLNLLSTPAPFRPGNFRHLLATLKPFFPRDLTSRSTGRPQKNLPLILFPYASASNLPHLAPVAREAQKKELLGLIVAGESLRPDHVAGFDNVVSEIALWRLARKKGLTGIYRSAREKFKKLVDILEQLDPPSARKVRKNYGWIYRNLFISQAMSESFQMLLTEWRPSCVISTSDYWPFEFQLFCQAQRLGIPNAMIQHGELNDVISWPTHAETFLVWGAIFQEKLLKLGAPRERLRICGMPSADALFNRFQNSQPKAVNAASPVCLIFSHAQERLEEPATFATFARFLQEAIPLLPRVQWRIRLHPAEDDSFYRELGLIGHPRVQIQPRGNTLEDAVAEADIVCTIRSTAGLQAMMMRRPLIVLDLTPGDDCSVWWPLYGGGLAVKNPEAFKIVFDRLVDDADFRDSLNKSQQEFLNNSFASRGNATGAIVNYLEEKTRSISNTPLSVPGQSANEVHRERVRL